MSERAPPPSPAQQPLTFGVITTSYPLSSEDAAGHFVESECRALAELGHRVLVLRPGPVTRTTWQLDESVTTGRLEIATVPGGSAFGLPGVLARLRQRPSRFVHVLRFMYEARRVLRRLGCDRVIAHWLIPAGWPIATKLYPTTTVVHGSDLRLLGRLPRAFARLGVSMVASKTELRFVSERGRAELAQLAPPALRARIEASAVLPPHLVLPLRPTKSAARAALNLGAPFIAVVVARLVPGKRVDAALRCASLPDNAQAYVIGDGPLRADLQERFPRVVFLGRLPRSTTLLWIAAADVLISASVDEGAPTAIREARLLKTAVWSADAGDVRAWAQADPGIVLLPELGAD